MKKTGTAKSIGVAKFKEQCLALLNGLTPEGLVITKHGKPVARVIPLPRRPADLLGVLADKIEVRGDILSTGVAWESDAQS
jgi:hypothetical protein